MYVRRAALCAAAVALILPAAAHAATKTVTMGEPAATAKQFENKYGTDANAFFPSVVTVRAGDKVRFAPTGFHTVDLPPKGGAAVGVAQATGTTIAGALDAAGQPFWFNGKDTLGFPAALLQSGWGTSVAYDGTKRVDTGLALQDKPKPITVTFAKPGTYTYYCDVHAGMKGTVRVVGAKAPAPSAKADAAAVKRQVTAALKAAKGLAAHKAPAGTIDVGASGAGGTEYYGFFPAKTTVPVGTSLTFRMSSGYDVHSATTGPGDPEKDQNSYLGKLAAGLNSPVFDPQAAVYPSDAPGTTASLTPTLHGNGFWSTGVMDSDSSTPLLPASGKVTFAAAGTYTFYCLIHPFMHATVTVK